MRYFVLITSAFLGSSALAAEGSTSNEGVRFGMRIDCSNDFNLDKGATQECFSISGLRFDFRQTLSKQLDASLRLDPFGTPVSERSHVSFRGDLPSNIKINEGNGIGFGMVDHYKLNWQPRLNLNVAVEDYPGAAKMPSVSGLSLGSRFQDSGWDQTALTLTYKLGAFDGMNVTFAAGNGEGENGINRDPQQYFGFSLKAHIVEGINVLLGASQDGNSIGSESYDYSWSHFTSECKIDAIETPDLGHSTERMAIGAEIDGKQQWAKGLKVGVGFQRNILSDLDKSSKSVPSATELGSCGPVDLDALFVEDDSDDLVNTVQKTTVGINLRYQLLERYFVAFDYQQRRIDTGSVDLFQVCEGYDDTTCKVPGGSVNNLSQDSITAGMGVTLEEGLVWSLEYNTTTFDQNYSNAYYYGRNSSASDTWEALNSRISYHWN